MTNASTLARWVPRLIGRVGCLHTLFVMWFLATGGVWFNVGHLTHRVIRRTGRIPALVGWWTLGLAVLSVVLLPASGFWLALGVGILALVAARRDDRAAVALPTP
jgi:Family of unknown function (DUF6463)